MYRLSFLLVAAAILAVAVTQRSQPPPLSDAEIEYINTRPHTTWKAGRYFSQNDLSRVSHMLGVRMDETLSYIRDNMQVSKAGVFLGNPPVSFDARTKWPDCTTIAQIRDQSNCGSCWAFGSAEAISDRICVATGKNVEISAADINSCCRYCGEGCGGGNPAQAWDFYVEEGVVTGGLYNTTSTCMPYTLAPCEHHNVGPLKNCSKEDAPTPPCVKRCIPQYPKSYQDDKHFGEKSYNIRGVLEIQNEIMKHGPVTASFDVYTDFLSYKSGIYHHVTGPQISGHAVKILGWGVEDGTDYWLVANSWNPAWGEKGYFRIRRGTDECRIEDGMVAGLPKV